MKRKYHIAIMAAVLLSSGVWAQQRLTLAAVQEKAAAHYPLSAQGKLIAEQAELTTENLNKGYLPQLSVAGQYTYQSDVTKIALPIALPVQLPELSKEQYRIYGEVAQPLTPLLTLGHQKKVVQANSLAQSKQVEVSLYGLRRGVQQLYFNILLLEKQREQLALTQKDLALAIERNAVAVKSGVALKSSADELRAQQIKLQQREIVLRTSRAGALSLLSQYTGEAIAEEAVLEVPTEAALTPAVRPEQEAYAAQSETLAAQERTLSDRLLPQLALFVQGGYGRPALNMLATEAKTYYIGGVRLSWSLTPLYTLHKDKALLHNQQSGVAVQKRLFELQQQLAVTQQQTEIARLRALIATDEELIALRGRVTATAAKQLEYGTGTTTDYLTHLNAEDEAREEKALHEIQLLMAEYEVSFQLGALSFEGRTK
jgi:outer membrane efflux protein